MKLSLLEKFKEMDSMYQPMLALTQLGIAGFNVFVSKYMHYEFGVPKSKYDVTAAFVVMTR